MIEIRPLEADEWALWRSLRLAALREAPDAFTSRYEDWASASEARWRQRLSGWLNLVAALDGEHVGMVGCGAGDPAPVVSLWVAPRARGRGVGDALVAAVVAWAAPRSVELGVAAGNDRARALYLRHGFVEVGGGRLVRAGARAGG
ncbi:GNAT family N-acetyltransferase [Saccharothrix xinjiangensis]|uniref:GNAT family N-acetyltransferase n=1 Tax=Saccharothrix xinjiangensis TaxID=204798 RepID=A0ABV9XSE3_9PSEU